MLSVIPPVFPARSLVHVPAQLPCKACTVTGAVACRWPSAARIWAVPVRPVLFARTRPVDEAQVLLVAALADLRALADPARPKAERLVLAALAERAPDAEAIVLLRRALARGADPWLRLALIERLIRLGRPDEAEREKTRLASSRDPRAEDARRRLAAGLSGSADG